MSKFADQLFDDLMREHGATLAQNAVPAAARKRYLAARPVLLTAGAAGLAVAATVGTLAAGGGTPAYAVTAHPDGTVTLAVYQASGINGANVKLHNLGDKQVVVVPVRAGCPSILSLPAPTGSGRSNGNVSVQSSAPASGGGTVTVDAHGIPAGDVLVVAFESAQQGRVHVTLAAARLTSAPPPGCVSIPGSAAAVAGGSAGGSAGSAGSGAGAGG
jgi:hypothetical protein